MCADLVGWIGKGFAKETSGCMELNWLRGGKTASDRLAGVGGTVGLERSESEGRRGPQPTKAFGMLALKIESKETQKNELLG